MKIINTRVLVPEEVKLDKVKHANLVVTYEGRDSNEYRYVTMPFMLTDSSDIEKIRAEIQELYDNRIGEYADGIYEALEIIDKHISGEGDKG